MYFHTIILYLNFDDPDPVDQTESGSATLLSSYHIMHPKCIAQQSRVNRFYGQRKIRNVKKYVSPFL